MEKKLFKNKAGNIHFGINAPDGFVPCENADVTKSLAAIGKRKLWRCNVCNDLHLDSEPPKICPTCTVQDAYVEIGLQEFKTVIGL